jgi:hypothetical protein
MREDRMSRKIVGFSVALIPLLLAGCGASKPPACGDESTLDLIRSIIQRELGAGSSAASLDAKALREVLAISLAHPTSFDEAISRYSCEADLTAPFNNPGQDVYKLRLEYTSQVVDGDHLAEVRVLPGDLIGIGAAIRSNLQSKQKAPEPAAAPLASEPAPAAQEDFDDLASVKSDDYTDVEEVEPSLGAPSPSFDCSRASSSVEQMICADGELARLDSETAEAFKVARSHSADPSSISTDQGRWRREVRDACGDSSCVSDAYRARLAELN